MEHEWLFYEVMWRRWARQVPYPFPWWVRQAFRRWVEDWDRGLFDSKEAAFSSNALYRYWNMVGVKDHHQESLVGQAGEIEPVYDKYSLAFFLFEPDGRRLHLPQVLNPAAPAELRQGMQDGYLPVVATSFRTAADVEVEGRTFGVPVGDRQRDIVLARFSVRASGPAPQACWLCLAVLPAGPSGFQRHDRAGRYLADGRLSYLRYLLNEDRVQVNTAWGPVFDPAVPPATYGVYGNPGATVDPDHYLADDPFSDLAASGTLNGQHTATDYLGGMCTAVFAWPVDAGAELQLDVRLPVDDFRGGGDLAEVRRPGADVLDQANLDFWRDKLDVQGLQATLPSTVAHLPDLFRLSRANLLILADQGVIHPGPTIYDSFWVRDSSVEGIACALAGDVGLAERQFGDVYPSVFNLGYDRVGPVSMQGFFGAEHEKHDREWDSNGQALWAFGRLDRILGQSAAFGARMFSPYVVEGARWIRDNRNRNDGLFHSGWSAEHLGSRDVPHYWDDLWGLAGLYEAGRLAERIGQPAAAQELWAIFEDLRRATVASIRWVLDAQRDRGEWRTYIPTGPANVGDASSTMIGAVAYFHPCRLYMGGKLGDPVVDAAFRSTLETIWFEFVRGGFDHQEAWHAYGPYLTLQLAHAFLYTGQIDRMDALLAWTVTAGQATVSRDDGPGRWQVVAGAWNEQHCWPIATDFAAVPERWWYMGDIPHGWAAAELNLLLRDILFFEADEDGQPHLYLAPGVPPHWLGGGESITVSGAPTVFGRTFGFQLTHDQVARTVRIDIPDPPAGVRYVYPCRLGTGVRSIIADGRALPVTGTDVRLPGGTTTASVVYE